jgi:hypothetical protein
MTGAAASRSTRCWIGRADPEITAVIRRDTARFVEALRGMFEQVQRDGEIDRDRDPVEPARFVHSTTPPATPGCSRSP